MEDKMKWGLVYLLVFCVMTVYVTSIDDIKLAAAMAIIAALSGATGFAFGISKPNKK